MSHYTNSSVIDGSCSWMENNSHTMFASDLGWQPGFFPPSVLVKFSEDRIICFNKVKVAVEGQHVEYKIAARHRTGHPVDRLIIIND